MRAEQIPSALKFANRLVDHVNKLVAPRLKEEGRYGGGQRIIDELDAELRELAMSKAAERLPRLSRGRRLKQTYEALIEALKELLSDVYLTHSESHGRSSSDKGKRRGSHADDDPKAGGDHEAKIIAGLNKHHNYNGDGPLNTVPVVVSDLAGELGIGKASVSRFLKKQFGGHRQYKQACADGGKLAAALKLLNGDFAPKFLLPAER